MKEITTSMNEAQLTMFIKDLLCLSDGGYWTRTTVNDQLHIRFKGNSWKVQKEIFRWLSVPERKHNFELLGGK